MTKDEVKKLRMDSPESLQFLNNATKFYNLMMMYRCAIREIQTKLEVLDDEFSVENNRNPISFIKTRIKKPNSIYNKLQKMGYEFTTENIQTYLNDVAGVRIVCAFIDDIYMISDLITQQDDIKVIEVKDYIKNPKPNGYRSYHMIVEIDGKVGFTGGYNLANEYFNYTHPYGQWKDTGIRLEGDAVQSLTVTFLEMWNAVSEKATNDTDFSKYIIHYDYKAQQTGFVQPYADSPMDNEQVGEEVYISMINKAEKYCWFMTPYLIITDEMTHALCLAAKRGVDVRIITPGIPDKKFIYNVTRSFYHGLVKHGVRVYEWTPGFCHAKMSVADDCMATCGTINLDYRSLYHHFENGCFMADCQAVVEIKNDLIRTMGECRDVTDQYQTGRSAYLRLGQLFMRLFAGLL